MNTKIKAGAVANYQDGDVTLMSVPWSIVDENDTMLKEGNQSFPLSATTDEIKNFLTQTLTNFREAEVNRESSEKSQAELDESAKVGSEISNIVIE